MTVADLQERMPNREFVHWQAFYARRAQKEEMAAMKAKRGR
jgi:hypothetical protein